MPRGFILACFSLLGAFVMSLIVPGSSAQEPSTITEQFTTPERIERSAWWPTDGRNPRSDYAGSKACSGCHYEIFKTQAQHSMARTSRPARESDILESHTNQPFTVDSYGYKIVRTADGTLSYTVSGPARDASGSIDWAFGAGKVGQSYLSFQGDEVHELRFSYFKTLQAFGVTPNQSPQAATSMDKAAGRLVPPAEARRCFGCHTSVSSVSDHFEPRNAVAGVSCESCHGP